MLYIDSATHRIESFRKILQGNILDVLTTITGKSFLGYQFTVAMYRLYRQDFKTNKDGRMTYIWSDITQFRSSDIETFLPIVALKLLLGL